MEISQHKRRHAEGPKYEYINDWFLGDLTTLRNKYLIPHTTESANTSGAINAFVTRKRRTANDNELRPAIEVHLGHLAQEINFGELADDERIKPILKDVTGYGCDVYEFLDDVKENLMLHGFVGVLVEGPNIPSNESRAEAAQGDRSYQVLFTALNIIDWKVFKNGPRKGQFSEVVVQNDNVVIDNEERMSFSRFAFPGGGASPEETFVREEWVAQAKDWKDGKVEVKLLSVAASGLTEIPFVTIGRGIRDTRFYGVAQSNEKLFNDKSVVDNTNYCQGFERTIISGVKPDELKPLNEAQILAVDNDKVGVHNIAAGEQIAMMERVKDQEQRVRKYARFDTDALLNESSKEAQSQGSKAHDMAGRIAQYENYLDKIDAALTRIFRFHCLYENVNKQVEIVSARDFGLDDRAQVLSERNIVYSHARELQAFETQKAILKMEIEESLDLPQEEKEKLIKEVDGLKQLEPMLPDAGRGLFQ